MHPSVSVLLPFCNEEELLGGAIESVLKQDFNDWELVLVNNASTDSSSEIAEKFAKYDSRIIHINEPGKGIAIALNTGLLTCRGKYIARLDADDFMYPERLKNQHRFLEENQEFGLVSGLVEYITILSNSEGYKAYVDQINQWQSESEIYQHRFVESPFAHPTVMFRKTLIEEYGLYSLETIPEDYELWLRWLDKGVRMQKLPQTVIKWLDRPNRLSRSDLNYSPEAFDTVRFRYLSKWLLPKLSKLPPVYAWGAGKLARRKVKLLEEYGIPVCGYIDIKKSEQSALEIMHYEAIPAPGKIFIISLVSNRGKHAEIRKYLIEKGYEPEKDFILAG